MIDMSPDVATDIKEVTITDPDTGDKDKRRTRFHSDDKGYFWQLPGLTIEDGNEVWIAEG